MSEKTRENISALMDDELEKGAAFIINAMKDDLDNRSAWQRYHLIGDALRGHLPEKVDLSLVDRISARVIDEPTNEGNVSSSSSFARPVIGFAIAASVAILAITGVRQIGIGSGPTAVPQQAQSIATIDNETITPRTISAAPASSSTVAVDPQNRVYAPAVDAETRLNRYLLNYNEYRANAGVQGMLPYVRIVTHETEQ